MKKGQKQVVSKMVRCDYCPERIRQRGRSAHVRAVHPEHYKPKGRTRKAANVHP